jgi:predicted DNA-binding transcriptional regulator AlpA
MREAGHAGHRFLIGKNRAQMVRGASQSEGMNTQPTPTPPQDDELLCTAAAAPVVGLSATVLKRMRSAGRGPRFVRLSRQTVRYRRSDLAAFIESKLVTPGSGP